MCCTIVFGDDGPLCQRSLMHAAVPFKADVLHLELPSALKTMSTRFSAYNSWVLFLAEGVFSRDGGDTISANLHHETFA